MTQPAGPRRNGKQTPDAARPLRDEHPDRPAQQPVVIDGGDRACVSLLLELRTRIAGLPACCSATPGTAPPTPP